MAKVHAQYVAQYVDKLHCSTDQKLQLIDAVADTILRRSKEAETDSV